MSYARFQRIESFPKETRDYNIEKTARWATDGFNVGDFVASTGAGSGGGSGTAQYAAEFSKQNQVAGVATLALPSAAESGANARLHDASSATLSTGLFEMDLLCRTKLSLGGTANDNFYPRVGFFVSTVLGNAEGSYTANGIYFERRYDATTSSNETTWFAVYTQGWNGSTGRRIRINTGATVTDWNTLGIWVSEDGRNAVWTVNDRTVLSVQDANITVALRAGADSYTAGTLSAAFNNKIDYMQLRVFARRPA